MTNDDAGSGRPGRPPRHDRQEGCLDRPREPLPTRVKDLPRLPAEYEAALEFGLADAGLTVDAAARRVIDDQVRLLLAWNGAINLSAIREPGEIAVRHVLDSLTALPLLRERGIEELLDLGSGAGYPGLPLAAALPSLRAVLLESIGKKAGFLRAVVAAVGLEGRVEVAPNRAEDLARDPAHGEAWQAVTARAVAGLDRLVELAFPLLAPGGVLVAWKRGDLAAELTAAARAIERAGGGNLEVRAVGGTVLRGHVLVIASRAAPRSPEGARRRP